MLKLSRDKVGWKIPGQAILYSETAIQTRLLAGNPVFILAMKQS